MKLSVEDPPIRVTLARCDTIQFDPGARTTDPTLASIYTMLFQGVYRSVWDSADLPDHGLWSDLLLHSQRRESNLDEVLQYVQSRYDAIKSSLR